MRAVTDVLLQPPDLIQLIIRLQLFVAQQLVLDVQEHHGHHVHCLGVVGATLPLAHKVLLGIECFEIESGLLHEVVLVLDDVHDLLLECGVAWSYHMV